MNPRTILDATLGAVILVGCVWAWRTGTERSGLEATYARLAAKTGTIEVGDPTRLHLRAIRTAGPLQFAWRAYVPPGPFSIRSSTGFQFGPGGSPKPEETIVRVGFREDRGRLTVYGKFGGASSMSNFGDKSLADFLRGRWDRVIVEQVGREELVAADPSKPLTLLRLTLPPDLIDEAKARLSPGSQKLIPTLYELNIP